MRLISLAVSTLAVAAPAVAQSFTIHEWTGAGTNNLWSNPDNWTGGSVPSPTSPAYLDFSTLGSSINDLPTNPTISAIAIYPRTSGTMSIGGNPLRFPTTGGIELIPNNLQPVTARLQTQVQADESLIMYPILGSTIQAERPILVSNTLAVDGGGTFSLLSQGNQVPRIALSNDTSLIVGAGNQTFTSPPDVEIYSGYLRPAGDLPAIGNLQIRGRGPLYGKAYIRPVFFGRSIQLNGNITVDNPDSSLFGPLTLPLGPHLITSNFGAPVSLTMTSALEGTGSIIVAGTTVTFADSELYSGKHTHTGVTAAIGAGTLITSHSEVLSQSSTLFSDPTSTIDLSSTSQIVSDANIQGPLNLSGATLRVGRTATPNQVPGLITGPVTLYGGTLIKQGSGSLTFNPTSVVVVPGLRNNFTIRIEQGLLETPIPTGTTAIEILPGATLRVDRATPGSYGGPITGFGSLLKTGPSSLTIAAGNRTLQLSSLTISAGALHITNNDLLLNYTGPSPISALISYLTSGQLTANANLAGLPTYLAIAESSDLGLTSFNGIVIDSTTVIAKYTYVGDANLDGQVDALDYERIDLAIGNSGVFGTAQGDLNYDGTVDALDYEQVDLNIGNGVGSPLASGPASVFIPEPAALAPLALAALAARRRR
jgi:MYXO-CTERM domain-containing protein